MTYTGKEREGRIKANASQASTPRVVANAEISDADKVDVKGLSSEQWQMLTILMNVAKVGANEKSTGKCSSIQWIIDIGASHYDRVAEVFN